MTEHAYLTEFEDTRTSLWYLNHRRSMSGYRGNRHISLCSCVPALEQEVGRCQFSIEENTDRIMRLCDWRMSRRNLLLVVFTVSRSEVLMTVTRVNASGVEMHHYFYGDEDSFSSVTNLIERTWNHEGECYIFVPGRREMGGKNPFGHHLSLSGLKSGIPGSCVVYLDLLSRFSHSTRRIGADARYWLEVSHLGVSSLFRWNRSDSKRCEGTLITAISYSDLAALVRLIVKPFVKCEM